MSEQSESNGRQYAVEVLPLPKGEIEGVAVI